MNDIHVNINAIMGSTKGIAVVMIIITTDTNKVISIITANNPFLNMLELLISSL